MGVKSNHDQTVAKVAKAATAKTAVPSPKKVATAGGSTKTKPTKEGTIIIQNQILI
jgi:hypothetical protein